MGMTSILTAGQMRWADQATIHAGTSGFTLMDRAGRATASAVLERIPDYGRVVIVTGPGNNGGDGFATALHLRRYRIPVTVVTLVPFDSIVDDSRTHADLAVQAGVKVREACSMDHLCELERWLNRSVMVVDALFGTGLSRGLDELMTAAIACINKIDRPVLSIDIASGICSDTGMVMGAAVKANFTLPVAASKWGHWLLEGRDYTGELLNAAEIGITDETIHQSWRDSCEGKQEDSCFSVSSSSLIGDGFLERAWPKRPRLSHKGNFGHVWIFGGSTGFAGAPQLAGLGAYAAGSGLVSIACPDEIWPVIAQASLDIMVHPESSASWQSADALVTGPGWGAHRKKLLLSLFESEKPLVVDADALNVIAGDAHLRISLKNRSVMTVMTPHPGEAARLLDTDVDAVQRDRKRSVLELVKRYGCWVVLKGSETLIASPDRAVYLNPFGSPQLAIAGSGDVLSGMIGAQLARMEKGLGDAGLLIPAAVALHGKAGGCAEWYLASELAKIVAGIRQTLERGDGKDG